MPYQTPPYQTPAWPAPVVPMFPPPPAGDPGRASRRWVPWVAAVAVVAVVALIAGVMGITKLVSAVTGPTRGANAYLRLVRDGEVGAAYGSLCSEARQGMTAANYAAAVQDEADRVGQLLSFNVYHSTVELGGNIGVVQFSGHTSRGDFAMEAKMVHEDGLWRWCGSRPQANSTGGPTVHVS